MIIEEISRRGNLLYNMDANTVVYMFFQKSFEAGIQLYCAGSHTLIEKGSLSEVQSIYDRIRNSWAKTNDIIVIDKLK